MITAIALFFGLGFRSETHTNTITCVCTHLHARLPGAVCLLALRSNRSRAGRGTKVANFGRKTIKRESSSLVVLQIYLMYSFGPKGVKGEEPIVKDKTNRKKCPGWTAYCVSDSADSQASDPVRKPLSDSASQPGQSWPVPAKSGELNPKCLLHSW